MHRLRDALVSRSAWLIAAVALIVLMHVLGSPRNVGPDEASHQVGAAALVRGEREGVPVPGMAGVESFEVPGMVGLPSPSCFALDPDIPVACSETPLSTTPRLAGSSSQNYPPYALALPGLASFVPWPHAYAYLARLLSAAIPVLLLGVALHFAHSRRGPLTAVAVLAGLTPIAWFTVGVTNPSAIAIAGGTALWVALLCSDRRTLPWFAVAGWAGLLMARRDGPFWATAVVLFAALSTGEMPRTWWAAATRWQRLSIVAAVGLAVASVPGRGLSPFAVAMACAPIALVAVEPAAHAIVRHRRRNVVIAAIFVAAVAVAAVLRLTPQKITVNYLVRVVQATGEHLYQIVGRLGTLDASAPLTSVILWWSVVGALAGLALVMAPRSFRAAGLMVAAVIVAAWLLEIGSGNTTGSYWQGRYSLPVTVGLPLLLVCGIQPALTQLHPGSERRLVVAIGATSWWVWNATFFAAQRRWAVGANGTVLPWRWNTWDAPVPPVVMLGAHGLVTALAVYAAAAASQPSAPASEAEPTLPHVERVARDHSA